MQEKRIHQVFVVSVAAKGLHAIIEIVGGLTLYLLGSDVIERWLRPHEWAARHFSATEQHFYAFYLLSHGLIKGVLVFFLLRQKLWAYPASIAVFGLFIAYQLYRWDHHEWVTRHFSTGEHRYYVWFFLSHGALNLALAIGLLLEKLWAYPAAMVVLALFIVLQLHRFTHVHDPGLIFFSLLDVVVIALAVHEYRLLRKHLPTH